MKILEGYKTKTGFYCTIDVEVLGKFKDLSDKKSVNKSKLIENLMIEWIEKNKENK